ncbi:hypothetical protein ABZP36_014699 [Zizania latifolia]
MPATLTVRTPAASPVRRPSLRSRFQFDLCTSPALLGGGAGHGREVARQGGSDGGGQLLLGGRLHGGAMSFFSTAAHDEEVELDGRVLHRKRKLTAAVVEVRWKGFGELVAVGRQWMTPTRARLGKTDGRSKL